MDKLFAETVVEAVRSVTGNGTLSLHEPSFEGNEIEYLEKCIESTMVSYVGPFVQKFESSIAEKVGAKFCFCTNSGTAALHLALLAADVGQNDEVLLPAMSFVAPANAVSYCRAEPHFVEVEGRTLGIDVEKLHRYLERVTQMKGSECINIHTNRPIKAIIAMHTFGHPVDMIPILSVAQKFNIRVIEDAAEAFGTKYNGKHVGIFGDVGAFSFNGNKIITSGGGGAVVTNNEMIYERVKHIGTTAKVPCTLQSTHDEVGYNYRMPNLNAALGLAQLENLATKLKRKRNLTKLYNDAFSSVEGVCVFNEQPFAKSNYWLQTLLLEKEYSKFRDLTLKFCQRNGLNVRPLWTPLDQLPPFQKCPKMDLSVTQDLLSRVINLPSSPQIGR